MAGIQLTGADMQSRQDMSGAMPTATVEEIDVPVFIDEFLQNIEATSSTSRSSQNEEIGQEILTETDIFDFDFDIDLIAKDPTERKEMDQCNLDLDCNYSDNYNSDLTDMGGLEFQQLMDDGEEVALDMNSMCNSIDFTANLNDEIDLGNILTSEENPMLSNFSQGSSFISSSQTKYINELPILPDENSMDNYYAASQMSLGFGLGQLDGGSVGACNAVLVQEAPSTLCLGAKRTASAASLISSSVETMPQKRSKLLLNINKSFINQPDVMNTPDIINEVLNFDEINPPSNISTQDAIYEDLRSTEEATTTIEEYTIVEENVNTEDNSSHCTLPDFSAPSTPNSSYYDGSTSHHSHAVTCQTGFAGFITAPVSPAFSTASTSAFSGTTSVNGVTKRKRGRPAKEHADGPDPELMSQMTDEEAKAYRDRIKNNEASRVSRRKNKMREEDEAREEETLQAENLRLTQSLQREKRRAKRLTDYLKKNFHSNSTYVKPEPEH